MSDQRGIATEEQGIRGRRCEGGLRLVPAGDERCPGGAEATLGGNVGRFYHSFIGGYSGGYGEGSDENRFFPALGNPDWASGSLKAYRDFFDLPGNGRYYDVAIGPVRWFIVDSDPRGPDGNSVDWKQARWLRTRLSETAEPWKIVVCHHPPYSSGRHGSAKWMQWPFQEWGATAVIAGHDHHYERILRSGFPYFVNGLGGAHVRRFRKAIPGSKVRFASDSGAMRISATAARIVFDFINLSGETVDRYALESDRPPDRR